MVGNLPAIFFGHGNPMNALQNNAYTRAWSRIGQQLPRPRAILAISAHWYVPFTGLTADPAPRTLHDFGGFPPELYRVQYPAPGDAQLVRRVQQLLVPLAVRADSGWGLDHGTWSVLRHVYPKADVPVVQLSIDETQPPQVHFELGRHLTPLRAEGVLIAGSGNLVHNLHTYSWGRHRPQPYEWATRFERRVRALISAGQVEPLIAYEQLGPDALLSVPTPDHYLPLLYVLGARLPGEVVSFPVEGVDGGSISMLLVQLGDSEQADALGDSDQADAAPWHLDARGVAPDG